MALDVGEPELGLVRASKREILLGIILSGGTVRLHVAGPDCPGHVEWLACEPSLVATRGFSLLVKNGRVEAIFPRSRLNPGLDARLEQVFVDELVVMLPGIHRVRILE